MEAQAQSILIVAGIRHQLSKVLMLSKTMPTMSVRADEFMPFEQVQVATVEPADPKLNHGEVIVFRREGKLIIITGRETVRSAVEAHKTDIRVTLLSAQALKRCKLDAFVHPDHNKPLPAPVVLEEARSYPSKPSYPRPKSGSGDEYRNAPRIIDKRQPTYDRPHSTPSVFTKDVRTAAVTQQPFDRERNQRTQFGVKKSRPPQR